MIHLYIWRLQQIHFTSKDTKRLKVKGWKKIFLANNNQKSRVAVLKSENKKFVRNKEWYYINKVSTQQENTIINIYLSSNRPSKYIKQSVSHSVMSESLWSYGLWPTRLLCPWISQVRILEWIAISFSRDLPNPGIEPVYLALAGGFFTTEPPGKPFLPLMRAIISSKRLYPHDFS